MMTTHRILNFIWSFAVLLSSTVSNLLSKLLLSGRVYLIMRIITHFLRFKIYELIYLFTWRTFCLLFIRRVDIFNGRLLLNCVPILKVHRIGAGIECITNFTGVNYCICIGLIVESITLLWIRNNGSGFISELRVLLFYLRLNLSSPLLLAVISLFKNLITFIALRFF